MATPSDSEGEDALRGMTDNEVEQLFAPTLDLVEVIRGNPDHFACRWYLLQKG